jgi:hypothetical protein
MEMESSDVKKKWSTVWKLAETEHVIINYYTKPVAVLISWNEYKRMTGAIKQTDRNMVTELDDSEYASLATEAMKDISSTSDMAYESNGTTILFNIKFSTQADVFIKANLDCYNIIKTGVINKKRLAKVKGSNFYKREVNGFRVIYMFYSSKLFVAYIDKMNNNMK